jgi:hypothetical protein
MNLWGLVRAVITFSPDHAARQWIFDRSPDKFILLPFSAEWRCSIRTIGLY